MPQQQWWRGLLARVTIAYALGSLVLSAAIASFTYTIAQDRFIGDFHQSALEQFSDNAIEVRKNFQTLGDDADLASTNAVIESLNDTIRRRITVEGSFPVLIREGGPARLSPVTEQDIPEPLRKSVRENDIAEMYYKDGDSEKLYAIGVQMPDLNVDYYEITPLSQIDNTLGPLRLILIGVAIISSLLGATLVYYAARRALAPISRVSSAAHEIAEGNFQTKLNLVADPDLASLSSSFNAMVDALRKRVERDERFTSDVSHELRSPLMTLSASIEVLEKHQNSLPEPGQQAVSLLSQDLKRFENLVEDLLEISRMDAGAVQLQPSQFELPEFLINVIAQSNNPGIELRHSNRDKDLVITADKRRIAQVISNLITNADKYAGGATGISFRQVGKSVQIAVEDEGPGIPPQDRNRIFDRFSRGSTDAGNRAMGTGVGLGLSLVAEHIKLHDGRVWVTDRIDGITGARFVVEIPVGEQYDTDEEMAT